jgi:hypothetical protein
VLEGDKPSDCSDLGHALQQVEIWMDICADKDCEIHSLRNMLSKAWEETGLAHAQVHNLRGDLQD